MVYHVGDRVRLKKKHPCGSFTWEIMRVGADFRMRCEGCDHVVMLSRPAFEKNVREVLFKNNEIEK